MNSRFFSKKDEVILSTATALIVGALVYIGIDSLLHTKEHAIFQKSSVVVSKK